MQIIESTPFGVRSAVLTVARPDTGVRFVIFPMMHLGSVEYFREVDGRLRDCDRILAEGVTGRRVSVITASYRLVARIKRLDLVEQGKALNLRAYGDRVTNVDVSAPEFGRSWRRVPRAWRLLLYGAVPFSLCWRSSAFAFCPQVEPLLQHRTEAIPTLIRLRGQTRS